MNERDNDMWLEIDADGIRVNLQIKGYKPANKDNWYSNWCNCDFLFTSGDWLNYHKENDEVLLSCEVEELAEAFTELLDNKLSSAEEIAFIEPDFVFKLYPQRDLSDDPKYKFAQSGYQIQDIYLEWNIFFWHEGLTDNYLTITLNRDDIVRLRDYLSAIMRR